MALEYVNYVHPKLRNIKLHNITRSLISQNPGEWMFVVQILLPRFSPLYHKFCHECKSPKKSTPPSHCAMCQYVECHLWVELYSRHCSQESSFIPCIENIIQSSIVAENTNPIHTIFLLFTPTLFIVHIDVSFFP